MSPLAKSIVRAADPEFEMRRILRDLERDLDCDRIPKEQRIGLATEVLDDITTAIVALHDRSN